MPRPPTRGAPRRPSGKDACRNAAGSTLSLVMIGFRFRPSTHLRGGCLKRPVHRSLPAVLLFRLLALGALAAGAAGCSIKTMAVKTVANTLSDTGDVFTRDNDPELVRDAIPFALKTYESLLESVPT